MVFRLSDEDSVACIGHDSQPLPKQFLPAEGPGEMEKQRSRRCVYTQRTQSSGMLGQLASLSSFGAGF
jgi:hypothetical protein